MRHYAALTQCSRAKAPPVSAIIAPRVPGVDFRLPQNKLYVFPTSGVMAPVYVYGSSWYGLTLRVKDTGARDLRGSMLSVCVCER